MEFDPKFQEFYWDEILEKEFEKVEEMQIEIKKLFEHFKIFLGLVKALGIDIKFSHDIVDQSNLVILMRKKFPGHHSPMCRQVQLGLSVDVGKEEL